MTSPPPQTILIVGGSLAGLLTAIPLKRQGHSITILERSPTPLLHDQGAGVVAGGPLQDYFARYDATRTPIAVTSRARQYLDIGGEVIDYEERAQRMTSWDLLYNILRANFDGAETGYCSVPEKRDGDGEGRYEYGRTVKDVRIEGGKVAVEWEGRDGKQGTEEADMVIAADGPSSTLRGILDPGVKRKYVGYVAWRGTVPEPEVEEGVGKALFEKFTFYHAEGIQILAYLIPGPKGSLRPGDRLLNWVWYNNSPADSKAHEDLMTDASGYHHHFTMPHDSIKPAVWTRQKELASRVLPPQFASLVHATKRPFVQVITDVLSPKAVFEGGKVVMVGDAVAGLRPHTAFSTSQAAAHALGLADVFGTDDKGLEDWEKETMESARRMSRQGSQLGERSQFGRHPLDGA